MTRRKALVIGNAHYSGSLESLEFCISDADYMSNLLQKNENQTGNFEVTDCRDAGAADMQRQIDMLFEGEGEIALLYFSGHGCSNWIGRGIVGSDGRSVSLDDMIHRANASHYRNRIVILDSCFAGAAGEIGRISGSAAHEVSAIATGVSILCSCRAKESAYPDLHSNYSYFTSLLIDGLEGRAAAVDGKISLGALYAYIDRSMNWNAQRPVFKTNVDGFCVLRSVHPSLSEAELHRLPEYFSYDASLIALDPSFEERNTPDAPRAVPMEPYALKEHVEIFKYLQKLVRAGLAEAVDAEHMYDAAMTSKACRLTRMGQLYWHLYKKKPTAPEMPPRAES